MPFLILHSCLLCGDDTARLNRDLCQGCEADLPWIDSQCKICGLPLPETADQLHCGECLANHPPYTLSITPLLYQAPLNRFINRFKHHNGLIQGKLMAQLLAQEIRDDYLDKALPEVIIPVPLYWRRFLWRGYNQSHELAKYLSKELSLPCDHRLLKRQRYTPSQQGLSREQRLRNLKGAFQVAREIPYQRIALLDDVVTTGSTASEISRLLLKNGATEIHLWALARTPLE